MHKLVMWSGGIDSTYALASLLKETDHRIHAHHIHLINREGRSDVEDAAIRMLGPKLRAIRNFSFSTTLINHCRIPEIPFDMAIVCFEAGVICRGMEVKGSKIDSWTIGTHKAEGHNWERWEVIKHACNAGAWPQKCADFELQPMLSKQDEKTYLKSLGLLEDCWYCRSPVSGSPCGKCKTCEEVSIST